MCPNCGARLPRCAVCDFWVGEVDPRSKGARARAKARAQKEKKRVSGDENHSDEKALNGNYHERDKDRDDAEREGSEEGSYGEDDEDDYDYDESDEEGRAERRASKKKRDGDLMAGFVEICLACRHVYHRGHAREWFARHDECAAVGCRCLCGGLDGGVVRGEKRG